MPASKAKQAEVAERRRKAVSMRIAGADWDTIVGALGYPDRNTACKDVRRAMEANRRDMEATAEELRSTEVARLDRLQAAFWPKALKGDTKAAEIVRRCIMDRAKLQGTTAPEQVEHTGGLRYEIVGVDPNDLA